MNEYPDQNTPPENQPQSQPQYQPQYQQPYYGQQQLERVISIGEWLRLMLVSLFAIIPFIGWIISLVIYIVKATDTRLPQSYRNLIKAGFIWLAIGIALGVLLVVVLLSLSIGTFASWYTLSGLR